MYSIFGGQMGETIDKKKPGRPYVPSLVTLDEGVRYIRTYLKAKYPYISDIALETLCLTKKTLYNYRSNGKITKHSNRGRALVDARELEKLVS